MDNLEIVSNNTIKRTNPNINFTQSQQVAIDGLLEFIKLFDGPGARVTWDALDLAFVEFQEGGVYCLSLHISGRSKVCLWDCHRARA